MLRGKTFNFSTLRIDRVRQIFGFLNPDFALKLSALILVVQVQNRCGEGDHAVIDQIDPRLRQRFLASKPDRSDHDQERERKDAFGRCLGGIFRIVGNPVDDGCEDSADSNEAQYPLPSAVLDARFLCRNDERAQRNVRLTSVHRTGLKIAVQLTECATPSTPTWMTRPTLAGMSPSSSG